jgi:5-methylthioadenosine/S-adenosylhomocysteine deaminase
MKKSLSLFFLLIAALSGCWQHTAWLASVENGRSPLAVHGSVVSEDGARDGWVVIHRGVITAVTLSEGDVPPTARKIRHEGYIFPGLIDTHNHPNYGVIAKWSQPQGILFENRYQWRGDDGYKRHVANVMTALKGEKVADQTLKYGEIRAVIGGTTSIQGASWPKPQDELLVRNLDTPSYLGDSILDIERQPWQTAEQYEKMIADARNGLEMGTLRRLFIHLAEGKDEKSRKEFDALEAAGLVKSQVVLIHAIALTRIHFRRMAREGIYLVWSPSSNLALYGQTTDVEAAIEEGVTVAIAPDWTVSGSDNLLEELAFAYRKSGKALTPRKLFAMATTDAAKVAGVDRFLGRIKPGYAADLFLAPRLDDDPYKSLIATSPAQIQMVLIDGMPVYGDRDIIAECGLLDVADEISVPGPTGGAAVKKVIVTVGDLRLGRGNAARLSDIDAALNGAFEKLMKHPPSDVDPTALRLAPLIER